MIAQTAQVAARARLKGIYGLVRNLPDRVLRARRYDAACVRLARMARPRVILVVCYGNICRSPYLHAVLARALPDVEVSSAGFVGAGRPAPTAALAVSAARGHPLLSFRSRALTREIARRADLVLVMDALQARLVARAFGVVPGRIVVAGDLDEEPSPTRGIHDPFRQPIEVFEASYTRLERCAATLVRHLRPPA